MQEKIKEKLANLPAKPGVYLFKDKLGEIIYIGKAKILRNRVRSYFQSSRQFEAKLLRLAARIADIEIIVTDSEVEALILEANMVKENKPRYNINLKDDKSFPYIRVTNEPFPRIFPTRKIIRDGSQYFGPYTDVQSMRNLLITAKRIFPVRSCNFQLTKESIDKNKFKICLDFHIHRCLGPCEGLIGSDEYKKIIENVIDFIQGHSKKIENSLMDRIKKLASELRFEEAARLRDQLNSIQAFQQKQKVFDTSLADRDILGIASEDSDACCIVFKIRDGKIIGRQHFFVNGVQDEQAGVIAENFIKQYYIKADFVPKEIIIPAQLDDKQLIGDWLSQKRNGKVDILFPQRGSKAQLLKMCNRNARLLLDELKMQKIGKEYIAGSVQALQQVLNLKVMPKRIEGFDISNIQGTNPVASMVCFVNGKSLKSDYRRFKIQIKETPDDFAMMHEAVTRRYSRLLKENKPMPDLILIDGGKGQLSAAMAALKKLNIENQQIISLAKRLDEVYMPGLADPQNIRRDSSALKLLQRVRDESHRFAVSYHRLLRKKRTLVSVLEDIPGIGVTRRDLLLKEFGSITKIKKASIEELAAIKGMPLKLANEIYLFFNPGKSPTN